MFFYGETGTVVASKTECKDHFCLLLHNTVKRQTESRQCIYTARKM